MKAIAVLVCLLSATALAGAEDVPLVREGAPAACIVAAGAAGAAPARELQTYLERMSGARLEIVGPDEAPGAGAVWIGAAHDLGDIPCAAPQAPHSFARKTARGNLYLVGGDAEGASYAVSDLLEDLGCRWFMPGEIGEVIPRASTITARACDIAESPAFESRHLWYAFGATTPEAGARFAEWQRHNKLGHLPFFQGHNFAGTIPPDKYFAEHPEYYSLVDGKRQTYQLCTTNPDVIRIAAEVANAYFDRNPNSISYSLCPDDNSRFCECPACRALDVGMDPHLQGRPNVTDRLMVFWNAVAQAVWERHPGKRIAIYAYINHTLPPQRESVHPGVMPIVTTSVFCGLHSVADLECASRQEFRSILGGWGSRAEHVYIYEYDPMSGYLLPCPRFDGYGRCMKIYRDLGVKGFTFESYQSWATTFPNYYVLARLMWDPDEDLERILDDMCDRFFGGAAAPMRRYYRALGTAFTQAAVHTPWGEAAERAIWRPDIMRDCRAALDEAAGAADSDLVRRRVEMVDLGFQYLEAWRTTQAERGGPHHDAALTAYRRLGELLQRMHGVNEDFILANDWYRRKVLDGIGADLKRAVMHTEQFKRDNDVIAMLPVSWRFALDPDNAGVRKGWAGRWFVDWDWPRTRTDKQWHRHPDLDITGYGWVRTRVEIPERFRGRKVILWVGALDEEGWIYVNGRLAFRRRAETYDAWRQPFECDIAPFVDYGETNTIAVRAYAEGTLGGLWQRALLYSPK